MRKFIIYIFLSVILFFATAIWGNYVLTFCAFKIKGINVDKIGYFVDNHLSAKINISKGGKRYNVTINNLSPTNLFSNSRFNISEINSYSLAIIECVSDKYNGVSSEKKKRYIGNRWWPPRILFKDNSIINDFFAVKIKNIPDFIDNIDVIEKKLMSISMIDYGYFINKEKDEIYYKRIKIGGDIKKNRISFENRDSLFIFKNEDCACSK